jgi:NAD(P)-dependent dehydrogenase (short-subunit alcohol dehydrogenase family)
MIRSNIFAPNLLTGKHALITGGGTGIGIGFACALELGALGARVTLVARRDDVLQEATRKLACEGIDAGWYSLNIRDNAAVEDVMSRIIDERGLPDHSVRTTYRQVIICAAGNAPKTA